MFFDGSFLRNQSGIGRDARVLLRASEEVFGPRLNVIYPNFRIFRRDVKTSTSDIQSKVFQVLVRLRILVTGKPERISLPDGSIFIQPHLHSIFPTRSTNLKHIVRLHDIFPISNPEWFRISSRKVFEAAFSAAMNSDVNFICDSEFTRKELTKMYPESRSTTAYCAVQKITSDPCKTCLACTTKLPDENYFLAVGTIEPRKNYKILCTSWQLASPKLPADFKMIVVGKYGWKSQRTKWIIQKLRKKGLIWLRDVCDYQLNLLIIRANGFISTSFQEGFNLTIAEALIRDTPVIMSNNFVHKEIYYGLGVFIHNNDVLELVRQIQKLALAEKSASKIAGEVKERLDFTNALEKLKVELGRMAT